MDFGYETSYFPHIKYVSNLKKVDIKVDPVTYQEVNGHLKKFDNIACEYCYKYYGQDLMAKDSDQNICFHCLFWINYNPALRPLVDGVYGKLIVDYILENKDYHDFHNCDKRFTGCCLVCDYLNGLPIENILNSEKLDEVQTDKIEIII